MVIRLRTAFVIILVLFIFGFLYAERAILTPFIVAGIFAYIFNPFVNFFTHKIKLPRTLSVIAIYFIIISAVAVLSIFLIKRALYESSQLALYLDQIAKNTQLGIKDLPEWIRPYISQSLESFEAGQFLKVSSFFLFFPKAVSGIISLFVFVFSGFYFLKEGSNLINKVVLYVPRSYKIEVEILLKKINAVLNGYLRGQILLVFLVSIALFIALSVLGVKFALIIAIFSGFAEIVPIIGPIFAAGVAMLSVLLGGSANFGLAPVQAAILVGLIYFVLRQIEDYFVIPVVMGKITRLHPLIILFAVLAGGHIGGILGLILAVPIAAIGKLFLEFFIDTINIREARAAKK